MLVAGVDAGEDEGAWLLLLKSEWRLLERPQAYLLEDKDESSDESSGVPMSWTPDVFSYLLLLLPGQLDGALSPIIVLATVAALCISFALSSDRQCIVD
jgi:hypothetical protein